jgi:hypothetical protein
MMPVKINIKTISSFIIMMILLPCKSYSQGTDIMARKQNHFYIGFNLSPVQTSLFNDGALTNNDVISNKKSSFSGAIEAGYSFSKYIGISTGLGYSSYVTNVTMDTYDDQYDTIDSDSPKENYKRIISGENIEELQKISFLTIPVLLDFHLPVSNKFGIYLQTGVNFSIPVSNEYTSSGTFTYEGYYSKYNVLISSVDYEGFKTNYQGSDQGELKIKSLNTELIASAGASYAINEKMIISAGILYSKLLSDMSDYETSGTYHLSSMPDQIKSIMEGSTETSASSIGIKISFRYYLK